MGSIIFNNNFKKVLRGNLEPIGCVINNNVVIFKNNGGLENRG